MKYVIGISSDQINSVATLVDTTGLIHAHYYEYNFSHVVGDRSWPYQAIEACKRHINQQDDVTYVYHERPWRKFFRRTWHNFKDRKQHYDQARKIKEFPGLEFIDHEISQATAACVMSPYMQCQWINIDLAGEWAGASWGIFDRENGAQVHETINYPNSPTMFLYAMTKWLGLTPNMNATMLEEIALTGQPRMYHLLTKMLKIDQNGVMHSPSDMSHSIEYYLGRDYNLSDYVDWCASVYYVYSDMIYSLVKHVISVSKQPEWPMVLTGIGAQNGYMIRHLIQKDIIPRLWLPTDPTDGANSLGAAFAYLKQYNTPNQSTFVGNRISEKGEISTLLLREVTAALSNNKVVAWIQDNLPMSSRTLGQCSLLASPTSIKNTEKINKINKKHNLINVHACALGVYAEDVYRGKILNYRHNPVSVRNTEVFEGLTNEPDSCYVHKVYQDQPSLYKLLNHWYDVTNHPVLLCQDWLTTDQTPITTRKTAVTQFSYSDDIDILVIGNTMYTKEEKPGLDDQKYYIESRDFSNYDRNINRLFNVSE